MGLMKPSVRRVCLAISVAAMLTAGRPGAAASEEWEVRSPDGALVFVLRLGAAAEPDAGRLSYTLVRARGSVRTSVLERSALGVRRDDQRFVENLRLASAEPPTVVDETYSAVHGKRRSIRHRAQQQTFTFVNEADARLEVVVRVADDGAAFRYGFPDHDASRRNWSRSHRVHGLRRVPARGCCRTQPAGQYTPAYEDLFVEVAGRHERADARRGGRSRRCSRMLAVARWCSSPRRTWTSTTRRRDSRRRRLAAVYRDPVAGSGRRAGRRRGGALLGLPWTLPWRVLIVGRESLPTSSSPRSSRTCRRPSAVADTSWIRPGRASHGAGGRTTTARGTRRRSQSFIDFAAEMGWEYSLVDANWNLMDPAALAARAGPRAREERRHAALVQLGRAAQRGDRAAARSACTCATCAASEFAKLRDWGIKGVKVDFWQSDKQDRIRAVPRPAARRGRRSTCWSTSTGARCRAGGRARIRTSCRWRPCRAPSSTSSTRTYPAKAAWHNTVLAFTRNVVGPMDYTPVTFSDSKYPQLTTTGTSWRCRSCSSRGCSTSPTACRLIARCRTTRSHVPEGGAGRVGRDAASGGHAGHAGGRRPTKRGRVVHGRHQRRRRAAHRGREPVVSGTGRTPREHRDRRWRAAPAGRLDAHRDRPRQAQDGAPASRRVRGARGRDAMSLGTGSALPSTVPVPFDAVASTRETGTRNP